MGASPPFVSPRKRSANETFEDGVDDEDDFFSGSGSEDADAEQACAAIAHLHVHV